MSIQLTCGECQKSFKVKDEHAGKKIRCPKCKQGIIQVPSGGQDTVAQDVPAAQDIPGAQAPSSAPAAASAPAAVSQPAGNPAANDPNTQWSFKSEEGDVYGPITRTELDEWVSEGRVTAKCQLAIAGTEQWQWASEVYPQLNPEAASASTGGAVDATSTKLKTGGAQSESKQRGIIWLVAGILLFVFGGSGLGCGCCGCQISGFAFLSYIKLLIALASLGGAVTCAVFAGLDLQKISQKKMDEEGKVFIIIGLVLCVLASLSALVGVCAGGAEAVGMSFFGGF